MPILLSVMGIVLVIAGLRNRITGGNPSLVALLKQDFTGSNPFWKWAAAIFLIGAIGYIDELKPISRAFMVLVIIVFLFSNEGVFANLEAVFTTQPNNELTQLNQYDAVKAQAQQNNTVNYGASNNSSDVANYQN